MAQVTMNGKEYEDLITARNKYYDLVERLVSERRVHFSSKNEASYWDGDWPSSEGFPDWMNDYLVSSMENWLLSLPKDEFTIWYNKGSFFYNPVDKRFTDWPNNDKAVNLVEHSPYIRERCEIIEKRQNEASDES